MSAVVTTNEKQLPEPVQSLPSNPMEMLARAVERGASMDQLQQLMDLQDRWEANQARKAFVAAMSAFKASAPEIEKDRHVEYTNSRNQLTAYDHVSLGNACRAIVRGLAQNGISHRWTVEQADARIKVTCILTHSLGHSESVSMNSAPDDSGGKNSIQAISSAVTYLQRYTLFAATGLAALDHDDDGRAAGTAPEETALITQSQAAELHALAEEVRADPQRFLKYMGVERCADIKASDFNKAVNALRAKGKK